MTPRTVMILVDGLGLGPADPAVNPLHGGACPVLASLMADRSVPLDACMGVDGLPQSATGQTALLTGVNAAEYAGRHIQGFPNEVLRGLIRERNIFGRLLERGYTATFANAYFLDAPPDGGRRHASVTTVATLAAFGQVRTTGDMLAGRAVYQDLTRDALVPRGYTGPLATPEESAADLARVAGEADFTLFEYFQTDRVAHRGERADRLRILGLFDRFLRVLVSCRTAERDLLVITSDHGNIEDERTPLHTRNPVPLIAVGYGADRLFRRAASITDVTPLLLELYPPRAARERRG